MYQPSLKHLTRGSLAPGSPEPLTTGSSPSLSLSAPSEPSSFILYRLCGPRSWPQPSRSPRPHICHCRHLPACTLQAPAGLWTELATLVLSPPPLCPFSPHLVFVSGPGPKPGVWKSAQISFNPLHSSDHKNLNPLAMSPQCCPPTVADPRAVCKAYNCNTPLPHQDSHSSSSSGGFGPRGPHVLHTV